MVNLSRETNRDCFATDIDNVQLVNDDGRLRLIVKNQNYVSKTNVNLSRYFNTKEIRHLNDDFVDKYFTFGTWTNFFKQADLDLILNKINWSGCNPVFKLLQDIKKYEQEIELVV